MLYIKIYTIWYIPLGLWYIPVESGIYHHDDATFQMRRPHDLISERPGYAHSKSARPCPSAPGPGTPNEPEQGPAATLAQSGPAGEQGPCRASSLRSLRRAGQDSATESLTVCSMSSESAGSESEDSHSGCFRGCDFAGPASGQCPRA